MMIDELAARRFWRWFEGYARLLSTDRLTDEAVVALEGELSKLGDFVWELGPGVSAANMFAISPRGDRARLELTRQIVGLAPRLPGWEFLPAKPAKPWTRDVVIKTALNGRGQNEVAVHGWRCVLLLHPDGFSELILVPPDADGPDPDPTGVLLVDLLLGEEDRLTLIDHIAVVPRTDAALLAKAKPLEDLPRLVEHLRTLRTREQGNGPAE